MTAHEMEFVHTDVALAGADFRWEPARAIDRQRVEVTGI